MPKKSAFLKKIEIPIVEKEDKKYRPKSTASKNAPLKSRNLPENKRGEGKTPSKKKLKLENPPCRNKENGNSTLIVRNRKRFSEKSTPLTKIAWIKMNRGVLLWCVGVCVMGKPTRGTCGFFVLMGGIFFWHFVGGFDLGMGCFSEIWIEFRFF